MTDRELERNYRRLVMRLNAERVMSARDRCLDRAYGIFVGALIILPLIAIPILLTFERYLACFALIVAVIASILGTGLYRRQVIFRRFYKVPDASGNVVVVERSANWLRERPRDIPVLAFEAQPDGPSLTFLYNWLLGSALIDPSDTIEVAHIYPDGISVFTSLLCIPANTAITANAAFERADFEAHLIGARWI